jgi:hypothetical protein
MQDGVTAYTANYPINILSTVFEDNCTVQLTMFPHLIPVTFIWREALIPPKKQNVLKYSEHSK